MTQQTDIIEVLIVEDDPRIAEIHRRFTQKIEGFQVVAMASTGEQAKEWLEVIVPQLVLLDVYLPDMKGTDLVQFIRQSFQEIDIIMITAGSEVDIVRHAPHGGVFDFIVKPLTFDRFKQSMENYRLQVDQLQQQNLSQEQIETLWHVGEPLGKQAKPIQEDNSPKGSTH